MILMLGASTFLRALLGGSAAVSLENVALRHQLAVLQRSANPFHSLNLAFACAIEFQRHGPCPKQRYGNGPVTAAAFGWRYRSVESFGPEASVSPLAQSGSGVRVADLKGPLTRRLFEQILGASSDSSGTPPMELIKVEVGRHRARLHCAGRMESREKS